MTAVYLVMQFLKDVCNKQIRKVVLCVGFGQRLEFETLLLTVDLAKGLDPECVLPHWGVILLGCPPPQDV